MPRKKNVSPLMQRIRSKSNATIEVHLPAIDETVYVRQHMSTHEMITRRKQLGIGQAGKVNLDQRTLAVYVSMITLDAEGNTVFSNPQHALELPVPDFSLLTDHALRVMGVEVSNTERAKTDSTEQTAEQEAKQENEQEGGENDQSDPLATS